MASVYINDLTELPSSIETVLRAIEGRHPLRKFDAVSMMLGCPSLEPKLKTLSAASKDWMDSTDQSAVEKADEETSSAVKRALT